MDASFLSPNNNIKVSRSKSYSNAASSSIITRGTVESEDPYLFQLSQRPGTITPRTKKRGSKRKKGAAARWSKKPRNTSSGGGNSKVNVTANIKEESEFIEGNDVFLGSDGDSDLFGSPVQSISGAVGQRKSLKTYNAAKGKVASNKSTGADRPNVKRRSEGGKKPTLAVEPRSPRSGAQKYTSNLFDDITDTQEVKIDDLSLEIDATDAELLVESTSKTRPKSKRATTDKPCRNTTRARRQEQKSGSITIDNKEIEPPGGEPSASEDDVTVPNSDVVERTVVLEVARSSVILFRSLDDDEDFAGHDDSPEGTPALVYNNTKQTAPTSDPRSILSSQGFITSDLEESANVEINDTPMLSPERSRVKSLDRILESASLEDESKSPVRNVRSRRSGRPVAVTQRDSSADGPSPIVCRTRRSSMRVRDASPKHYEELSSTSSTMVVSASIDLLDKKLNFTPNLTPVDSSKKRLKSSKSRSGTKLKAKRSRKSAAEPNYDSAVRSTAVPDRITSSVSHQEEGRRQVNDQAYWNMEETLMTKMQELQREVQEQSVIFQREMKSSLDQFEKHCLNMEARVNNERRQQLEKHYLNLDKLVNNKVQSVMVLVQEEQSSVGQIISNRFDEIKSSLFDELKNWFEARDLQHPVPLIEVETMLDKETITTQKDETDECIQTEVGEAISVQSNTDIVQFVDTGIQPSVSILPACETSNDGAVTSSADMFPTSACSVNQLSPGFSQALDEGVLDDIAGVEDVPDDKSTQPECSISAVSEVVDSDDDVTVLVDDVVESTENSSNSSDALLADAVVRAEEADLIDTPDVVVPVLNTENIQQRQMESKQGGSGAAARPVVSAPVEVPPDGQYVICYSNLSHEQKERVATFMDMFSVKLIRTMHPVVTHLIIGAEKVPGRGIVGSRTIKFMRATASKKWIVAQDWVDACIEKRKIVDENRFEVNGDTAFDKPHYGPRKSRTDSGRIFDCVNFWILPPFAADVQTEIGVDDFKELLRTAGGNVVEDIKDLLDFNRNLTKCFIIHLPSNSNRRREFESLAKKYGIPTVNREWTLDCILSHSQLPFWSELYGPSESLMKLILTKHRTDYSPFDANVGARLQN